MDITIMSHAERLALLRALAAITHVCAIDGCDNEPRHRCEGHAAYVAYTHDADVCDEHWGSGLDGKCLECQPVQGPYESYKPRIKIGETITVRRPARYSL